ncbi:MAG: response regulator, partial [Sphaerochaetaceae bacterium]
WMETLHHGQEIYILSVANLSDSWKAERESLILQDIKSILIEPIIASQQLIGFVGFDTVWDYKDWPENVRDLLHFFAHILGAFFARVQSEKRLKERLQRSSALVREKEDINNNMQNFYAKISHDIRTSLNAIVSTGKLLEQSALDSIQNNYVSMINASSMFLKNLLNDLLDFSAFSKEGFEIRTQQISVWEVVKNSVDALRVLALEKGLSITIEYEEIIPVHLYGDGVRLTQILINLLHNAVKYSSHGLIQVSVGVQRLSGKDALLEFVVMDQGKGMDKGMVQSLFPYGGKTPVSSPDGGYGLGLSIVKQLIDAMHGSLSVESAPGEGSTFSFVLPFALAGASTRMTSLRDPLGCPSVVFVGNPSHEANAFLSLLEKQHLRILRCTSLQQIPERNVYIVVVQEQMLQQHNSLETFGQIQKARNPPFLCFLYAQRFERANYEQYKAYVTIHGFFLETQPMMLWYLEMFKKLSIMEKPESLLSMYDFSTIRVLVVDDTSINLEILKYKLESMQVTVETAKTGKDALRILKKASFDIIFMDLHLPGLDGIQTTEMIRAFAKDVWVVALSAYISETEKAHCRRVGIEEYLRKPVEQGDLIEILCRYTAKETE